MIKLLFLFVRDMPEKWGIFVSTGFTNRLTFVN